MNGARAFLFDARERRFMRAVELFFIAFTSGRLEDARRVCSDPFSWFGRTIDRFGWATDRATTFHRDAKMSFAKLRSVPDDLLAILKASFSEQDLFDGTLGRASVIALVDMTIDGSSVTVGAVVDDIEGEPKIARIFDPGPLRSALERLGNSAG